MNSKKHVFITTPIYYSSGQPHIGHAYSTNYADALAGFYRLCGYETYFLTGSDEHGQKIEQAAQKANVSPLDFVTQITDVFKHLWSLMGLKYDRFIRTTEDQHKKTIQTIFQTYQNKKLIYLGEWSGFYCVSCEENYTEVQAIKNNNQLFCTNGHELTTRQEPSYFFKMSQFCEYIVNMLQDQNFLQPAERKNELVNLFLNQQLPDLSVSRTNFHWGIPVLSDNKHVIYVWLDALFNYLTALNYLTDNDHLYQKFWNDPQSKIIHITAKEISRFHAIYWPIFLKALDVRNFDTLISHGWILSNNKTKMSKSLGNVIDPFFILKHFPRDGFRYFLLTLPIHRDNSFSYDELVGIYNSVLVNNYGNLISRLAGMVKKYCDGQIPNWNACDFDPSIVVAQKLYLELIQELDHLVNNHQIDLILDKCFHLLQATSQIIENLKPWELKKQNETKKLNGLLFFLYQVAVLITFIYQPVCQDSSDRVFSILGVDKTALNLKWFLDFNNFSHKIMQTTDVIVYQRLEPDHFTKIFEQEQLKHESH